MIANQKFTREENHLAKFALMTRQMTRRWVWSKREQRTPGYSVTVAVSHACQRADFGHGTYGMFD